MRITITKRIGFTTVTILLVVAVMVLYAYQQMQIASEALHDVVQIYTPISAASFEMETNIVGIGLAVFKYLDEPSSEYRLRMKQDISEFTKFMSQYDALASSTDARNMGKQAAALFHQYSSQAVSLLQTKDSLEQLNHLVSQDLQELDSIIYIQIDHSPDNGGTDTRQLLELKVALAELIINVLRLIHNPGPELPALIVENSRKFNAGMEHLKTSLQKQDPGIAEQQAKVWQRVQSTIREILVLSPQLYTQVENFITLRRNLDNLLDEGIQKSAEDSYATAQQRLENSFNLAVLRTMLLLPLFAMLLLVSMFQLWRSMRRQVFQLTYGAERFGLGDLDYRVPQEGDDELAHLANRINQMAEELQESRKDAQEMAQRQRQHADVLQNLIRDIEFHPGTTDEILGYICETIARTLAASRASIWMFSKEKKWLYRLHTYAAFEHETPSAVSLDMQNYPLYSQALGEGNILMISDTRTDPRGAEVLRVTGTEWTDMSAILDVPFYSGDNLLGILSCIHGGTAHPWQPEEVTFGQAAASLISLVMEQEESRRSRQEAEAANQAKSVFLSRMSHELRTPLNSILGFSQFVQAQQLNLTHEQRDAIMMINSSGKHLLQLINEVLDIAHVESGKLDLRLEPVWVGDVLNDCEQLLSSMAKTRNVSLVIKGSIEGAIVADSLRFKQVLLNLMSNAIKYNKPGGIVTVECIHAGKHLRFNVIDTGIGIPIDKQPEVFVPFNRFAKDMTEGTGIGLTITKQLTEAMGGRIGFSSEPGAGSTFWLEFLKERRARVRETAISTQPAAAAQAASAWAGVTGTVLYVEDTTANILLLRMILKRQMPGITLLEADTGEQGVELALAKRPDLILMDIDLPGISGIEAFKLLKNNPATHAIPVIALSASAMQQDIDRVVAEGFNAYITKPFNIEEIPGAIAQYLKTPSL